LAKKNHKNSKIVYCSSGAVYGQQPPDIDKISENFDFNSVKGLASEKRNYALEKRNSEESIIKLGVEGLSVSIARCFTFYGKYLPKDQHFAYGNFVCKAEKGEIVKVNA
jgi:nucleoside-diphosphate-sugar epimerase